MSKVTRIIVMRQESVALSWARDASTFALILATIGVGVFLESAAMQWLGGVLAFLVLLLKSANLSNTNTFDIEGAKKRLAEIEAEQGQ